MTLDALRAMYDTGQPVDEFARHTAAVLAPHGFDPGNALAIVGVCRDEMMFPVEHALHDVWGPAFDMSSLAGMVLLGVSGLAAAAGHAPGRDGRRRYVHVVMPHIGLDDELGVGFVRRDGQSAPSTACGALVGLQRELSTGSVSLEIDDDDLEMSLLRRELVGALDAETLSEARQPDLVELTMLVRVVASAEILRLSANLLRSSSADVALFSTLMIHGSAGDRVAVVEQSIWIGDDPVPRPLGG